MLIELQSGSGADMGWEVIKKNKEGQNIKVSDLKPLEFKNVLRFH